MSFFIALIRNLVGSIIVFVDLITRGRQLKRPENAQKKVEMSVQSLRLYQFFACPFCIKTRRKIYQLNLPIKTLSASKGSTYRDELLAGGGKIQVPCLRIEHNGEVQWMYESSAIIDYLEHNFRS